LDLSGSEYNNISLIVDNTFYPCNQGAYQSEVYLYQVINLTIEESLEYMFVIKIGKSGEIFSFRDLAAGVHLSLRVYRHHVAEITE
jgi:hypothetical protein